MKILFVFLPFCLCAHPTNPEVMAGGARFARDASNLIIETGEKTIIEWKDFSIGPDECTRFLQPTSQSVVLNRVVSEIPSSLLGKLEANGQVLLINPNGIVIGKDCCIQTSQFIASTMNVSDEAFLGGEELLFTADRMAKIEHLGQIISRDGDIYLIAPQVDHSGNDSAKNEIIAVGSQILFRPKGEERIAIVAPMPSSEIKNGYDLAINLQKDSHLECSQSVLLKADEGTISANGSISVPSGAIEIFANEIEIGETAQISTSALQSGNGGRVILYADGKTEFHGSIEAKGGLQGGDGGFIEVSGRENLIFDGRVCTLAPQGKTGMLLLDPTDFTISTGGDINHSGGPAVFSGTAAGAVLNNVTLITALNMTNVTVTTASVFGDLGSILIIAPVDNLTAPFWTAATSLTLIADLTIDIKDNVANPASTGIFCTAVGTITIGDFFGLVNASLDTGGAGPISLTSTSGVTLRGGDSATSNALINGSTVDINAINLALYGGINTGSNATINGTSDMNIIVPGSISINGYTGDVSNARITNTAPGSILTIRTGSMDLFSGPGMSANTEIFCDGTLDLQALGDMNIWGGGSGTSAAALITLNGSGTDLIDVAGALIMTGGAGSGFVPSLIDKSGGTSDLFITVGGNMIQSGQSASAGTAHANIIGSLSGGSINLDISGLYQMSGQMVGANPFQQANIEGMNSPINILVAADHLMFNAEIFSTASIFDDVGQNFTMSSSGPPGLPCRVESTGADIFIRAGDNVMLTGTDPALLPYYPRIVPFTQADVIAGNDFILNDYSAIYSSNAAGAILNLVCDNDFPTPPGMGVGAFITTSNVILGNRAIFGLILGDFLRIFTSQRGLNSIQCPLNGDAYSAGPFLIDSPHERWCIWYFDPYYLPNHVIFYKECEVVDFFVALTPSQDFSMFFRDLNDYNEYIYLAMQFSVFYERASRPIMDGATDSFDLYDSEDFFIRRRSYEGNNISNQISPTAYEPSQEPPLFE